jgi:hypothetical protein
VVIRISEGPTAADRHETGVAFFREDQPSTSPAGICIRAITMSPSGANPQRAPVMHILTSQIVIVVRYLSGS